MSCVQSSAVPIPIPCPSFDRIRPFLRAGQLLFDASYILRRLLRCSGTASSAKSRSDFLLLTNSAFSRHLCARTSSIGIRDDQRRRRLLCCCAWPHHHHITHKGPVHCTHISLLTLTLPVRTVPDAVPILVVMQSSTCAHDNSAGHPSSCAYLLGQGGGKGT